MRYFKMNGCGNDFVILDARSRGSLPLSPAQARAIADRSTGVGCDQVIAVERSIRGDAYMRIWNADGGEVDACGNAARCVAWLLMEEGGAASRRIETPAGMLYAERAGEKLITVDMGSPLLRWEEIPLARVMDTARLDYAIDGLSAPGAVNMGNPHVVFFVDEVGATDIAAIGPKVEHDPLFPQRANVGFAEVQAADRIRLRVWERGVGLTKACGTGACAAVVAAHRQGRAGRAVGVAVDGGILQIEWRAGDDRVLMTGPIELEASGDLPASWA
ncbi:MAG: diaminopimelate epimerase [Hyphomonadaceae bacterium]|nr:diaminopimelate epimerase [Hyphomonadaceae bacterium]